VDSTGDRVLTLWRVAVDEYVHSLWTYVWMIVGGSLTCEVVTEACG